MGDEDVAGADGGRHGDVGDDPGGAGHQTRARRGPSHRHAARPRPRAAAGPLQRGGHLDRAAGDQLGELLLVPRWE